MTLASSIERELSEHTASEYGAIGDWCGSWDAALNDGSKHYETQLTVC